MISDSLVPDHIQEQDTVVLFRLEHGPDREGDHGALIRKAPFAQNAHLQRDVVELMLERDPELVMRDGRDTRIAKLVREIDKGLQGVVGFIGIAEAECKLGNGTGVGLDVTSKLFGSSVRPQSGSVLYRTDLQRTDRSSMASSIECRVPFLDRSLIEFAMALPFDLKVRNGVEKFVLREAFRGDIPDYMTDRPKIRMPEGIGIHDQIFNALTNATRPSDIMLPDINIDGPQIRNALAMFLEFGYTAPTERYKKVGTDYFEGGYFNFDEVSEQRSS